MTQRISLRMLLCVFVVAHAAPVLSSDTEKTLVLSAEQQLQTTSDALSGDRGDILLLAADNAGNQKLKLEAETEAKVKPPEKALPLPFHTIEGYGGGAITPMAYVVNPGPPGAIFGLPSASFTFINAREKNVEAFAVTETLFRRIELGYAFDRFGMGTLPRDIRRITGVDIDRNEVYLHNFNVRALLVEENSFNLPLPAITSGVHFKVNDGIRDIDNKLHGALGAIGMEQSNGVEFTLTGTKMIPKVFGRPLFLTSGLRNSSAAWLGFMGFGDERATTFEANAVYMPTDWLALAYEFRNNADPLNTVPGLIGTTDNWQCFHIAWIINNHCTLCGGYGIMGNMANTTENAAFAVQFKYEF